MDRSIRVITKRGQVYYKTNGKCSYCGIELDPFSDWHIDHIFPKSRGGSNELENLTPACKSCNSSKGSKTIDEWKQFILEEYSAGTIVQFYFDRFKENKNYMDDPFVNYIED